MLYSYVGTLSFIFRTGAQQKRANNSCQRQTTPYTGFVTYHTTIQHECSGCPNIEQRKESSFPNTVFWLYRCLSTLQTIYSSKSEMKLYNWSVERECWSEWSGRWYDVVLYS